MELSISRYPIPSPNRFEYARIFNVPVEEIQLDETGLEPKLNSEKDETSKKTMAIFELLEYIVNKVGIVKEGYLKS